VTTTSTRKPCHVTPDCRLDRMGDWPTVTTEDGKWLPDMTDVEFWAAYAEHREHEEEWAAAQPVGPCPFWCGLPAGHPWRSELGESLYRTHEYDCGGGVLVQQSEQNDGTCTDVSVWDGQESLTDGAAHFRRIAAGFLNAADKLDEITGGAR
jgi:hypothetical protein